jgi:hypothetical protein
MMAAAVLQHRQLETTMRCYVHGQQQSRGPTCTTLRLATSSPGRHASRSMSKRVSQCERDLRAHLQADPARPRPGTTFLHHK